VPISDDYHRWYKWAYEQRYGEGSWGRSKDMPRNLVPYKPKIKKYWDEEGAIGILELNGKFIGLACLAAKEETDKESYVRKFSLSVEKDVLW